MDGLPGGLVEFVMTSEPPYIEGKHSADYVADVSDFGHSYWRSATASTGALAPLTATSIDDATYRQLADNLPTLCWVANGDGYIVWYNRRWHEYCGTSPEQMEGWGWQSTHDPQLLPHVMERWTASIASGEPFEMTFPLRGADGVLRPFLTRVQPMRDATGKVARWFGVNTEIFDQVAAESALRAERDRSSSVLEGMTEGFVLLDRQFRVLTINAEGLRIEQRSRAAIIGKTHWEAWPGTEESEQGKLYKRVMAERIPLGIECHYQWAAGHQVWFDVRAYPHPEGIAIFYREIGDRKQTEVQLRESEAFTRLLLDSTSDCFYAVNCEGVTTLCNESFLETLGFPNRDGVIGHKLHDVVHHSHPDGSQYPARDCPIYQAASQGAPAVVSDEVFFRLDGSSFPVEYRAEPIVRGGKLQGAICTFRDITEKHQTEIRQRLFFTLADRLLKLSKPREIVAAAVEVLGRHLQVNRVGYGEVSADGETVTYETDYVDGVDHLVGNVPLSAFGRDIIAELKRGLITTYADVQADPRTSDADFAAFQTRSAMAVPLIREEALRAVLYLNHRDVRDWTPDEITLVRDVAARTWDALERARAEAQLRELNETLELRVEERTQAAKQAEARFRGIFDSTYQFVALLALDGVILEVNRAALTAGSAAESDMMGGVIWESPWFCRTPEAMAVLVAAIPAAAAGQFMRTDLKLLLPDDQLRVYDFSLTPVNDEEGRVAFIVAEGHDVTEAKHLEEALRQSQKMEAVGQLTGGIAHDFNNMLAVVIGSLDLLGRRTGTGDARASRYIEAAKDGARRASTLTQRLLAFSRQQPLKPEPLDVNKLVGGMSDLIRGSMGGDIRLETVLAAGVWRIHADPNQLENAVLNLAVNARDAMLGGGRLTIETQNTHLDARYVSAHLGVPAGQYVLIAVTDTGAGMSEDIVAKAFDPFFTTKEVGKGTGLGLSQVYGFVKQSGGHVKIYSEPGQGTSLKIYLPRLTGVETSAEQSESAREIPLGDLRDVVLVVEDEPAVRQFSVDALSELGYRVLEADGAAAALRLLDTYPEIALLFTDIIMPDVNGAKLATEACRRRPDLKVLFTTGYTRNAVVHNGVLDAGVELIGKPFTIEELAAKVREVLDAPAADPRA